MKEIALMGEQVRIYEASDSSVSIQPPHCKKANLAIGMSIEYHISDAEADDVWDYLDAHPALSRIS